MFKQVVRTDGNSIIAETAEGVEFRLTLQRTLRIPDDDKVYPLPPSLGYFPIVRADDFPNTVPEEWLGKGHFIIPMYQREAMWMSFRNNPGWQRNALMIATGGVNAVDGEDWHEDGLIDGDKQNYVVAGQQPWLDGIAAGDGFIKQFVAMPLGQGYTVEAQVKGEETEGGIQFRVFPAKKGTITEPPPTTYLRSAAASKDMILSDESVQCFASFAPVQDMGLGAGGRMKQQIDKDVLGIDTWDKENPIEFVVHIVNSESWAAITGNPFPPTPIDINTYTQYGFPWFDLYREPGTGVDAGDILQCVESVDEIAKKKGEQAIDGTTVPIKGDQVITYDKPDWPSPLDDLLDM